MLAVTVALDRKIQKSNLSKKGTVGTRGPFLNSPIFPFHFVLLPDSFVILSAQSPRSCMNVDNNSFPRDFQEAGPNSKFSP